MVNTTFLENIEMHSLKLLWIYRVIHKGVADKILAFLNRTPYLLTPF